MKIQISIPDYNDSEGIRTEWDHEYFLKTELTDDGIVVVSGDSNGLTSLARHLLTLAQASIPQGSHLHYDEWNSLEKGSIEIVFGKI